MIYKWKRYTQSIKINGAIKIPLMDFVAQRQITLANLFNAAFNTTPTKYDNIFCGMTDEDRKAKKWIERHMKRISRDTSSRT